MAYNHYFGKPRRRRRASAAGDPAPGPAIRRVAGWLASVCSPMSAERLIRVVDRVSYWSGKAFAWLIVALTFVVSIEVFKRYILNAPTAWIFDFNNMLYGTLFMMCGAYTLAAGRPRARRLRLHLPEAARPGRARPHPLPPVLHPRHPRADLRGRRLRRADSWRIGEHSTVTAEGPPVYHFKTVIPVAGVLVMLQGLAEIVRCLRVPAHRAPGRRGSRTSRRSTSSTPSSATASTWTRSRAGSPWRARTRSTRPRAIAAWWTTARTRERSLPRPDRCSGSSWWRS